MATIGLDEIYDSPKSFTNDNFANFLPSDHRHTIAPGYKKALFYVGIA
jgi:hypothetical protein